MGLFDWLRKRKAMRQALRELPPLLLKDYGKRGPYKPAQIWHCVRRHGFSLGAAYYGISVYGEPASSAKFLAEQDDVPDFDALRAEVADRYFHGDVGFSAADVAETFGGDSGGDFGGGGDSTMGGVDAGAADGI